MSQITDITIKSIIAGVATVALDKYAFGESDITKSITFGIVTAGSIYSADLIASNIPENFKSQYINGKKLESELLELGTATAITYVVANNLTESLPAYFMYSKIGVIVASDLIGTLAMDYLTSKPLSFIS